MKRIPKLEIVDPQIVAGWDALEEHAFNNCSEWNANHRHMREINASEEVELKLLAATLFESLMHTREQLEHALETRDNALNARYGRIEGMGEKVQCKALGKAHSESLGHDYVYGVADQAQQHPFVKNMMTGRMFLLPWLDLIKMGRDSGIDQPVNKIILPRS